MKRKTVRYAIGIDLGGTKIEACLLDGNKNILNRRRIPSEAGQGGNHVIENILKLLRAVAGNHRYEAVGIGTPGTYSPEKDRLYGSPHTLTYEKPGFIGALRNKLSVPLIVENDANCLAIAEFYAGCVEKHTHVMAVILGTGVGSGLILDGKLYRGKLGGAGEFGHSCIDINGRKCECGRTGCVEAYLSGPSLSRRFMELSGKKAEPREIWTLYKKSDPQAKAILNESCRIMATAFANVINILDLDAIILGGGVSNMPLWYKKVPSLMNKVVFGIPRGKIPIIKAQLGDSAGVIGAGYLALREMRFMDF